MSSRWTNAQLKQAVYTQTGTPVYMTSKSEILEHYTDHFHGDRVKAASAIAREMSGESSGKAYKNARRNFEGKRAEETGASAKWRELGKNLPPISIKPAMKIKVTFIGYVKISDGRKTKRGQKRGYKGMAKANFSQEFYGADAIDPTFGALFTGYFNNFEENPVTAFEVSAIHVERVS